MSNRGLCDSLTKKAKEQIMEKKYMKPEIEMADVELEQLLTVSGNEISIDETGADGESGLARLLLDSPFEF